MIKNNKVFFDPWETIHESNPQEILEREEKVTLVPLLIMQGALDDNVLPEMQEKFVKTYKAAGGTCEYRLFENSVHEWVAEPGPQTDKAREVAKEFIARQPRATIASRGTAGGTIAPRGLFARGGQTRARIDVEVTLPGHQMSWQSRRPRYPSCRTT